MKINIFTILLLPIILPLYIIGLLVTTAGSCGNLMIIDDGARSAKKYWENL